MSQREPAITPASFASFGALLRYLRQRALLSRAELARAAGYSESQIARLELDQRRPDITTVQARFVPALGLDAEPAWVERLIALAKPPAGARTSAAPAAPPAADREMAAQPPMAGALASNLPLPPAPTEVAWPGGTTTFLFTDIEGGSRLWERYPQAMPAALQRHELLLRQAIAEHRGVVFKTVGDAVCAAFASALDALTAALVSQRALIAEAWEATGLPAGQPLRVRMAIHTGTAEAHAGDYVGPPLNRVARLLVTGHGGQILLSRASAELVTDGLPAGVSMHDLGVYQLSGHRRPEHIFQLVSPDLPAEFPPLRRVAPLSANPPAPAILLLTTKLYMPPARPNLVSRSRLMERLQAGLTGKLTLLAAPAGFGKTTLLSEWLQEKAEGKRQKAKETDDDPSFLASTFYLLPFKVAWVSLDAGDNDPTRFWSYVCAALDTLLPGVAETALALLQSPQPPPAETLLPSLLNAVSARDTACVLVLDDYHVIEAPAIHAALTFLLEQLPPRLHMVIASRADPPLPLARLRARGDLTELRAADLRFTPAEAAIFLTDIMGLPLALQEVAALEERTEGWIAGLQLAALAMRDRRDHTSFISAFTGSNRFVGEYLADEVFVRQPAHIQTFLLHTAILERMCGPLCDAVMLGDAGGASATHPATPGDSFSQVLLEELERANLFVVPLDDARQWYRYHHLFGEMLRARLLSGASAAAIARLHRRASAWYEAQALIAEAVQHALAAHEWDAAARLIKKHGMLQMQSGQVHTVLGWLHVLPAAVVQLSPTLCLVYAVGLVFTNQFDAAEVRLHDAERALQTDTPADRAQRVRGNVAVVRGGIRYFTGDLAQTVSLMQQALALLPELPMSVAARAGSARARAVAAVGAARVYKLTGDVTEASERQATVAIAPARATGYVTETLHSYTTLASLQVLQGRLRAAAATYAEIERLVPTPDALHSLIGGPAYYFGMGDLRREWNQLEAAEGDLTRGIALVQGGLTTEADAIVRGYMALARVQQARGDGAAALATLEAFMQLAHERQFFPLLMEQAAALRTRLQLLQGDLAAALRWADASDLSPEDLNFPREAAYLTLVRVRIAAGQAQAVVPLLHRLLADAEAKARMHSTIEVLTLQALAYDVLSDRERALTTLERALALAEPEGYVRIFVDEGAPMATLLRAAASLRSAPAYVERLLAAFEKDER